MRNAQIALVAAVVIVRTSRLHNTWPPASESDRTSQCLQARLQLGQLAGLRPARLVAGRINPSVGSSSKRAP
jgi:hypothetical protein